jgi:hypothetical protein
LLVAGISPTSGASEPSTACAHAQDFANQSLHFIKLATPNWRAAYDAAQSGIALSAKCPEPEYRLVLQAFLHSYRALAGQALHTNDWHSDLERANALLDACFAHNLASRTATLCAAQKQNNIRALSDDER